MKIFSTRNIVLMCVFLVVAAGVVYYTLGSGSSDVSHKQSKVAIDKDFEVSYPTATSDLLQVSDSEFVMGDKDAKVTFIDYASMSCPHCAAFYDEAFDELKKEYIETGKVRFVYRDFPLNYPSLAAASIAICRASQLDEDERAEGYHDFVKKMYDTQNSWIFKDDYVAKLVSIAVLEGMSKALARSCANDVKLHDKILKARMLAAKELEIQSTPTFFINGKRVQGFVGYKKIKELIEYELNR